jgi:hypothetical protein
MKFHGIRRPSSKLVNESREAFEVESNRRGIKAVAWCRECKIPRGICPRASTQGARCIANAGCAEEESDDLDSAEIRG